MSDQPTPERISELIPNTFPFPNFLIDKGIWRLLDGEEQNLITIVIRKTYGWWKRSDCISNKQLCELSGLSSATVTAKMMGMVGMGLIIKVADNDPHKNHGIEWALQTDDTKIGWGELMRRESALQKSYDARLEKARAARGGSVAQGGVVPQGEGGLMPQGDRPLMTQGTQNHLSIPNTKAKEHTPQKARRTAPPADAGQPFTYKWPHELMEIALTFEHLWDPPRQPMDKSEYVLWMNGGTRNGARGFRHYVKQGITPAELKQAFAQMRREKLTIKNPNSLWAYAYDIHDRNHRQAGAQDEIQNTQAQRRAEVERNRGKQLMEEE